MSDIKLFQINTSKLTELEGKSVKLALLLCKEKGWDEVGLIHHGLDDLEIRIKSAEDLEKSKTFILKSYEMS